MTISTDKLQEVTRIITHDLCADGTASAILLHDALPYAKIEFVQYGTPAYKALAPEPGILFVDFSPPPERAQAFVDAGAMILDHHSGAKDVVALFGENGVFADELTEPGISGASLAYDHVWKPFCMFEPPTDRINRARAAFALQLSLLAGVRDTWQRNHIWWHDACAQAEALHFFPNSYWMAKPFNMIMEELDIDGAMFTIGKMLIQKKDENVQKCIENAYRFTSKRGTRVIVFEGVIETSDAAEKLGDSVDLVIGFKTVCEPEVFVQAFDIPQQPKYIFSTRSHSSFNCSAFAKYFGGGGHTKAAGFAQMFTANYEAATSRLDVCVNPFSFAENCVDMFEAAP